MDGDKARNNKSYTEQKKRMIKFKIPKLEIQLTFFSEKSQRTLAFKLNHLIYENIHIYK